MASTGLMERAEEPPRLKLAPGPRWSSLDQLRTRGGAKRLAEELVPGKVGRLKVKNTEYVILHSKTFDQVYGLAQEVGKLGRGILLVRQAVQMMLHATFDEEGIQIGIQHLRDLTFELPELKAEPVPSRDLVFTEDHAAPTDESEDDLGFELDPSKIKRPGLVSSD